MAIKRTVDIGLEFTSDTNELTEILKRLKELQTMAKKPIDVTLKGAKALPKQTKDIDKASESVKRMADATRRLESSSSGLAKKLLAVASVSTIARKSIRLITGDYAQLEKVVYDLGIVSNMNIKDIQKLKYELIDFASTTKVSAKEMATAINTIERTGQTYQDSLTIAKAGVTLSVASGEDLSKTLAVTTKALVAFGINAESAGETFNQFHSAVFNISPC